MKVAARSILLVFYLHHCDLHFPDPRLPTPHVAASAREVWAETSPEEEANYLPHACRQFDNASSRQRGKAYPFSKTLYPTHPPDPAQPGPWRAERPSGAST